MGLWAWRVSGLFPGGEFLPPSSPVATDPPIYILLGKGFPEPGIHQIPDGISPGCVIKMAFPGVSFEPLAITRTTSSLSSGEALDVVLEGSQLVEIKRYWMPAGMRMTLAVPLHPDRMDEDDWEALPGIGKELARRIEEDRQINGDFGFLRALARVRGIGDGLISRLEPFFEEG